MASDPDTASAADNPAPQATGAMASPPVSLDPQRPPPDTRLPLRAADILNRVADAFLMLDHDWRVVYANSEACRINHKPLEEFVGKAHWDEWPAAVGTALERQFRRAMTEKVDVHFEHRYVAESYDVWLEIDAYSTEQGLSLFYRDISARKRAQEALKRSEERYRSLIDATAQIVWTNTPAGEMRGPNPDWGAYTGQAEDEYQGYGWASAVHPDDSQPTIDAWNQAVATRSAFVFEHRLRHHDGLYRTFAIHAVPVLEDDGTIREWVGVHTDITEQKRAEELSRERTRLAALSADVGRALTTRDSLADVLQGCAEALVKRLDAAFARVWTLNAAGDVLELKASAGLYTHLDGPHGRVRVGQFKIGLIAQERRPHLTNGVVGDPRVSDQEWARREGMTAFAGYPLVMDERLVGVVALFARQPLPDATLQALGAVADQIAVGIDRKRAETALRESEARKGAILEAALDCIITINEQEQVIEWNPAAERTFGYTRAQAVGEPLSTLIIPHSLRGAHGRGLAHYLATGEGPVLNRRVELPALHASGAEFPIELTVVPITLGGRTLFTAYLRDLTERERSAAQQRAFLRDVLLSVTEGRLHLCHLPSDLPEPLPAFGEPVPVSRTGGIADLRGQAKRAAMAYGFAEEHWHDFITATSEAAMNAVVHAGGGQGRVCGSADTIQVWIEDQGTGIDVASLPQATLEKGYTTAGTLGHGMKMMLQMTDRVWLLTGSTGTTVVLEQDRLSPVTGWLRAAAPL